MKIKIIYIWMMIGMAMGINAQTITPQALTAQGGTLKSSNSIINYSLGQDFSTVLKGGNNILSVGFLQPGIGKPTQPANQVACSDTAYAFTFYDTASAGANQIEWANNSSFDSSHVTTSPSSFSITVDTSSTDTVWIRSRYSGLSWVSSAVWATAKTKVTPYSLIPTQQDTVLCPGTTSTIHVPTSQIGVKYNLLTNSSVIDSAYGNGTTLALNTRSIDTNTTFIVLATDTLTGCISQLPAYLTIYTYKIVAPTPPAPRAVNSDTAYTFHFVNIKPGFNGNELEWSLDSSFTASYYMSCFDTTISGKDTSSCNISVRVSANSDTMIWLRSVDTVSGCVSPASATIAIVTHVYRPDTLRLDTIIYVCSGGSTNIPVLHSHDSLQYTLRVDTGIISRTMGNDTTLYLSTGTVNNATIFYITAKDTTSGDTTKLGYGVLVQAMDPIDTPAFIIGDTFVYIYDTVGYQALANNSVRAVYSITGGGANVDSLTGKVTGITGNFTLHASIYGPTGCGSASASLPVHVTNVAAPVAPGRVTVYLDSPTQVKTITFSSIAAGTGGDEIEFATNPDFTSSTIYKSPASISITLSGIQHIDYWVRSVAASTGNNSKSAHSRAVAALISISAGLLDKNNWVYSTRYSDEFNYNVNAPFNPPTVYPDGPYILFNTNFINKWNLIYQDGAGRTNDSIAHLLGNYTRIGAVDVGHESEIYDFGNFPPNPARKSYELAPGSGHEVGFSSDGVAHLKASRFDTPQRYGIPNLDTLGHLYIDTQTFYYHSGLLMSTDTFPMRNGMWEMRCKFPRENNSAVPEFWNFTDHGDFSIIDGEPPYVRTSTDTNSNAIDVGLNSEGSGLPGGEIICYKTTPCDYADDWHTFTAVSNETEMIFFIDGKETLSSLLQDPITGHYFPLNFAPGSPNATAPIIMSLQVGSWGSWDSCEMLIDYFRYYTPKFSFLTGAYQNLNGYSSQNYTTNNYDGQTFAGGVPVTLETLYNDRIATYNMPVSNNNPVKIVNNSDTISSTIAQNNLVFTNSPGYKKVYYQGTDGRMYNAYQLDGKWYEYPLMANISDVNGGISVSEPRVYYLSSLRGTSGILKYFQWGIVNGQGQWINMSTGDTIPGPAEWWITPGNINFPIDELGRVWFIGNGQNVYAYYPTGPIGGNIQKETTDGLAYANLTVWPCGCIMFYADNNQNLMQQSFNNGWNKQGIIASNTYPASAADVANGKLYFTGSLNSASYHGYSGLGDVFCYDIKYSNLNLTSLQKLGATCSAFDNALPWANFNLLYSNARSVLALSPDGNNIYYLASDTNIWYYYSDHDWGLDTGYNLIRPNWNRSPIATDNSAGIFTVEPTTGQLFYADKFGTLNTIDWASADNPILWTHNFPVDSNTDYLRSLEVNGLSVTDSGGTGLSITTYPNPSTGQFLFNINATNLDASANIHIRFYDIEGQPIDVMKSTLQPGVTQTLTWNTGGISPGIYYYSAQISGQGVITGKLIKL